jgi:hypothetical protein
MKVKINMPTDSYVIYVVDYCRGYSRVISSRDKFSFDL